MKPSLSYTELTLSLAMFITRFEFEKNETMTPEDMVTYDVFTAGFKGSRPRVSVSEVIVTPEFQG